MVNFFRKFNLINYLFLFLDDEALSPDGDLGSLFVLQVASVVSQNLPGIPSSASTSDFEAMEPEDRPVPLSVRRVSGRRFQVRKEGGVVGTGRNCYIRVPEEAGLLENHAKITWKPDTGKQKEEIKIKIL